MGFLDIKSKSEIVSMGVAELIDGLRERTFTAVEVVEAYAYMLASDPCRAMTVSTIESARAAALLADANIANGSMRPLEGVPFLSKALFCVDGVITDACSQMLSGFTPDYDATVIANLKAAGAIMLGQTNMDEFAMGSTTLNSCHGPTINPWRSNIDADADLIPGGSSGGGAAAVASYMAPFALGSDTGGSVRQPAALCGIVGIKPTYGLCSRYGMMAFASSLDQAGVFANNVYDTALLLSIMAGHDPKDSTSMSEPVPDYAGLITGDVKGMRIGIPKEYIADDLGAEVAQAWQNTADILRKQGANVVEISLPHVRHAIPVYYVVACAEASSNLARYDGIRYGATVPVNSKMSLDEYYTDVRSKYLGKEVKRRIMLGNYVLSKIESDGVSCLYERACAVRALIYKEFREAFESVDAILCPAATDGAHPINEKLSTIQTYYNDIFTAPVNLCGCPAMSVPVALNNQGLPLGMQIIGKRMGELTIFNIGYAIEQAVKFVRPKPTIVS